LTGLHIPGDDIIKVYGHPKMRGRGVYGHTGMALQFFGEFLFFLVFRGLWDENSRNIALCFLPGGESGGTKNLARDATSDKAENMKGPLGFLDDEDRVRIRIDLMVEIS
jgi:hypothetical protein